MWTIFLAIRLTRTWPFSVYFGLLAVKLLTETYDENYPSESPTLEVPDRYLIINSVNWIDISSHQHIPVP